MPRLGRSTRVAGLCLGYLGLVVWFTWPLAAAPGTTLPNTSFACTHDTLYSAWAQAWVSHAITTAPTRVADANIFFPDSHALFYGPAAFGAVPWSLPVFLATRNAALATNVAFLLCLALTAVAMHWVVWRWTGLDSAGFLAAWGLLTSPWLLWGFIPTAPHVAALQYFPLIVFLAAEPRMDRRRGTLLIALIAIQCLTEPVYVAPAVLAPLGLLALSRIARPAWRLHGVRLLLVLAAALVCVAPFLLGYAWVHAHNPALATQTPWRRLIIPTDLSKLLWSGSDATSMGPVMLVTIVAGALLAGWNRWWGSTAIPSRAWNHGLFWALAGTLISISPVALWGLRGPLIYLPQYLLAITTSLYGVVRAPSRLGVAGMMGFCLLFGVAFAEIVRSLDARAPRWPRAGWVRAVAALVVAVLVYRTPPAATSRPSAYPVQQVPRLAPSLLHALRAADGPVLDLPLTGPVTDLPAVALNAAAMYRSTRHWRPLLSGYSSYWPATYPERRELIRQLPDIAALRRLVCLTGLRTLLVHLDGYAIPQRAEWMRARDGGLPGLGFIAQEGPDVLFTVTLPAPAGPGDPACVAATPAS